MTAAGERRLVAVPVQAWACGIEEEDGELSFQCPDLHPDEDAAVDCPNGRAEFRWPGLEQLGARLRELRDGNGLRIEDVVARFDGSASGVSRIENGLTRPRIRDVQNLLDLCQVPQDDPERDRLMQQVRRLWGKA